MSTIKAVLLDAEEKQLHSHQVRNWLQRLGVAVHIADDFMDEFKTEALRRQLMSGNDLSKQVCTFFSASNQLAFRYNMVCRIREIRKKLTAISNDRDFHLDERHEENQVISRGVRETHSKVRQEEVIGRDEDRKAIIKLLLEGDQIASSGCKGREGEKVGEGGREGERRPSAPAPASDLWGVGVGGGRGRERKGERESGGWESFEFSSLSFFSLFFFFNVII